jgi:hypothetical protein
MKAVTDSRPRRTIERVRQIWAELDYAQRRLLEIRTGVPSLTQTRRASTHDRVPRPLRHSGRAKREVDAGQLL